MILCWETRLTTTRWARCRVVALACRRRDTFAGEPRSLEALNLAALPLLVVRGSSPTNYYGICASAHEVVALDISFHARLMRSS